MITRFMRFLSRRAAIVSGVVVFGIWIAASSVYHPLWLPTVPSVLEKLWGLVTDGSLSFLGTSGTTLLIGLAITFAVSAVLASLMAASDIIDDALLPYVNGFMAVPHIALIPMFTFIWGNSETTRIVTTISFVISPVILTWATALKVSPAELLEMSSSFGAGRLQRTRYVLLPGAIAPIITGLRIGVVQGIKGVVSAEVIIGVVGVGKLITTASHTFDIAALYAIVLVIIAISIASYLALTAIERRFTRWNA